MRRFLLLTIALMTSFAAFAQVTTSGLNGKVVDQSGEPLIGATVIAVHTPSGTEYGAATNLRGRYTIQGMRPGGPYTVTISYIGYQSVEVNNITLKLGDIYSQNADLKTGISIDDVVVISTGNDRFNDSKTGAASNFNSSIIESTPTVSRSIYDVVSLSPLAGNAKNGISFSGSNNRYNSFQIDGAVSNDVFGLSDTGTNGGTTGSNAVSLDAIEEIQVVIAPFDVRQGGFTGGGINAITKSGTNTFKGSAYTYYNNQNFYGTTAGEMKEGQTREKAGTQSTKVIGATAGGAIIEDKLFAFVSAEYSSNQYPVNYYPGYQKNYISEDMAKEVIDIYNKNTGFSDEFGQRGVDSRSIDLMARIDYNIDKNNKLMFRYQFKDAYDDKYSASTTSYTFNNSAYKIANNTQSFVAELNSRITNEISNEFRIGYTRVRDHREVGDLRPRVEINDVVVGKDEKGDDIKNTFKIGTDRYSGANRLNQDVITLTDNVSWYTGNNTLTFGTHNEFYSIGNTFIRNSTGTYVFNGMDDYRNNKVSKYEYSYAVNCPNSEYMPIMNAAQFGLYAQDEWRPNDRFTLTGGIRLDIPVVLNNPVTCDAFNKDAAANQNGALTSGTVPSAKLMISPRVGFRYFTDDTESSLIRGGVGIFTGRVPFVWVHNAYSNNATDKKTLYIGKDCPALSATPSTAGNASKEEINVISKDFKYPQVFRGNLAWEKMFEHGWKFTLEGLYSKTLNNVFFTNGAIADKGDKVFAVSADQANDNNTATYYTSTSKNYYAIINLENTSAGYTYSLSAMVEKSFAMGLNLMASYTFGHAYSVNDGDSSQAYSNWKYQHTVNSNDINELSYARFDNPHRITASINYNSPYYGGGRFNTVVGLNYYGSYGYRYDYLMNDFRNDVNGDGYDGNTLLYIPTDAELEKMTFDKPESKDKFAAWCASDKYASEHRGQFTERFGVLAPFEHHVNLHIAENYIYNKQKNSRVELSLDVMNIGNMFNREWGMVTSSTYGLKPLKVTDMTDVNGGKVPTYSWNGSQQLYKNEFLSRWHMQVGLRVTF